jgi:hypothetical protein
MKLGYLISQYPRLTATYVLREVRELRRQSVDVRVVSVRRCDRSIAELSADEAEEALQTFSVMGAGSTDIVHRPDEPSTWTLTPRQQREREYYNQFSRGQQ